MFFGKDEKKGGQAKSRMVPLLPLRDIIVFPHMVVPLFVGREKSINALEEAMAHDKELLLAAQKKAKTNEPAAEDIFEVGTLGTIVQLLRLPDGTVKVLVEGKRRARIKRFASSETFFLVEAEEIEERADSGVEIEALVRSVQSTFESYVKLNKRIPPEMLASVASIEDPGRLSDTIVAHLSLKLNDKQQLLETDSPARRLEKLYELMQGEIEILQVEKKIRTRVKKQMEKTQKEYYLNEQMQAIQKELGERDEFKNEVQELEEKVKNKKMSKEATIKVKRELKKLKMMSPMSAEATVVRNYVDWVLSLPWSDVTKDKLDIGDAKRVLDDDHYGLKKPKERILEYLAVQSLVGKIRGPVLCLVGPPGVGKTSLAKSIARSTGRKFVRLSLGGVRDEAEIRGHRRTYIGAMPGKLIQSLKKAGSGNPVFLLDEIDKMSTDFRGDPSAALLEVLDPEQNATFNDHYLDLDYDLSKIMFICTANTLYGIPGPLMDRMEVIRLAGYTDREKLSIAERYLVPKTKEQNGLAEVDVRFTKKALLMVIHRYTREAGVRKLEQELNAISRKIARRVLKVGKEKKFLVTSKNVPKYLGVPRFKYGAAEAHDQIGLVTGLAWTEVGGEMLVTEVTSMPGKGKLIITGKLGEVMQESAQAAMSYVRSRAPVFGIDRKYFETTDLHIHVPEGAMPKDGPSAGITMATALISACTRVPVRRDIAMTGEITLRGRVLPIGGLKEKAMAAYRGGIKKILIPSENEKDVKEIPAVVRNHLEIVPVEHMDQVLRHALVLENPDEFFRPLPQEDGGALVPAEQVPASIPSSVV
ncbi:endopeptidase La [Vulgatibacter incomptus]|uniref:Lon protease n=1 Tax=Vulgatibacter incomptus TaxID=1391653 RepID=A0A0K1P9M4_9BACT|nr:endopeptidase La [Vulgatibacter incomptus]AKU90228.1 ATP-dependent protease La [Vulgatibacter incomptus]